MALKLINDELVYLLRNSFDQSYYEFVAFGGERTKLAHFGQLNRLLLQVGNFNFDGKFIFPSS